jgi:hypothetical protein
MFLLLDIISKATGGNNKSNIKGTSSFWVLDFIPVK